MRILLDCGHGQDHDDDICVCVFDPHFTDVSYGVKTAVLQDPSSELHPLQLKVGRTGMMEAIFNFYYVCM